MHDGITEEVGNGEGCPLPKQLGYLGERFKLHEKGPDSGPTQMHLVTQFDFNKDFTHKTKDF